MPSKNELLGGHPIRPKLTALEFFSGIGGMHYALRWTGIDATVLAAFDINPNCNATYKLNFGLEPVQKSIKDVSPESIEAFGALLWMLSPPCQPYSRQGNQADSRDLRASGLAYILELLKRMRSPPKFLFLENVVGFERSDSHACLISTIHDLGYGAQEWILTPTQFGIPNQRPRYYLLATLGANVNDISNQPAVSTEWPNALPKQPVSAFLDVDRQIMPVSWDRALDPHLMIDADSGITGCFTKAYGHFGGSGSFLKSSDGSLSFFLPSEVARLHCFPPIQFPNLTVKQQWKLLGNSVSVLVIGHILKHGLAEYLPGNPE